MDPECSPFTLSQIVTANEWQAVMVIRTRVFVEEQNCPPEIERDAYDDTSTHLIGKLNDIPVACARWRVIKFEGKPAAKLERFAVLQEFRGQGLGRRLVERTIDHVEWDGYQVQMLHAQAHLEEFYGSFGFVRTGDPFVEARIPHIQMIRTHR